MKKIVMASNNKKKMAELQSLLADLNVEVVNQGSLGIPSAEEPFETFLENALAKARHASALSGLPAMADDSGICVEALGGAPGVKSARYAGLPSNDANNNAKLLRDLEGAADRRAHYTCVIVAVRSAFDPEPLVTTEHWEGTIGFEAKGEGGFGYDPYFVLPDGRHAAEISAEEKNRLSHRGKAMRLFLAKVRDVWHW
jgi:XTP/dITP diphosphohydrolase